jgi:oxygen-independent coproporphyrinogen-3 oxidase
LPVFRGYFLDEEDMTFRKYILNISCQGKTKFNPEHLDILKQYSFPELKKLEKDKLIEWNETGLIITPLGRHFIRNICSAFDLHLIRNKKESSKPLFSKAI